MIGPRPVKLTARQEKEAYAAVTERDGGRCVRCGRFGTVQRDHRQGRNAYNTVPSNLQCLCPPCHLWRTDNFREAVVTGFAVSRHSRPELWPAWRVGVGWVQYFDTADENGNWWQAISQEMAEFIMSNGGRPDGD